MIVDRNIAGGISLNEKQAPGNLLPKCAGCKKPKKPKK